MSRMGRPTHNEERKLSDLLDKSYTYLNDNFNKFDEKNKIHIALELIKKHMPSKLEHSGEINLKSLLSEAAFERIEAGVISEGTLN